MRAGLLLGLAGRGLLGDLDRVRVVAALMEVVQDVEDVVGVVDRYASMSCI